MHSGPSQNHFHDKAKRNTVGFHGIFPTPYIIIFALAFVTYSYFYQAGGANQNTRFNLVRSIVENKSLKIDAYHKNTCDKAFWEGHYYCDKAPGVSLLGALVYALFFPILNSLQQNPALIPIASYIITILVISLPSSIAVVMIYRGARLFRVSHWGCIMLALAYGFGTMTFPYSTLLYGHQLAASLLLFAFISLIAARQNHYFSPLRLFLVGVLLGASILVEYPAFIGAAAITIYAWSSFKRTTKLGWLLLGIIIPLIVLAVYNQFAFGNPIMLPYEFSTLKDRHLGYFMGVGNPSLKIIYLILFSSYRGLFYTSPWLALSIPGMALLVVNKRFRAEGITCAVIILLYILLNASLVDWDGKWTMGPRYLIPAIPFMALAVGGILNIANSNSNIRYEIKRRKILIFIKLFTFFSLLILIIYSIIMMLIATAVKPEIPDGIKQPYKEFLLPSFFQGQLALNYSSFESGPPLVPQKKAAWNMGELFGLSGLKSLIPLSIFVGVMLSWLITIYFYQRRTPQKQGKLHNINTNC